MSEKQKKALKAAFPHTIPILTGFLFLGFAYGVYMHSAGLSVLFWRFLGDFGGQLSYFSLCTAGDLFPCGDDSASSPFLRHSHAGQIPKNRLETLLSYLRDV